MAALMAFTPVPLFAKDYISQEQLDQAVVTDLPGRIGVNIYRERDPENMASNAISQISGLLADQTHLALGAIGGIATLGFLGVLSAPIAMIGAAAVGGLALIGATSDRRGGVPRGLSTPNLGHMGYGPAPNYGARSRTSGINGTVFGWSSSSDGRYPIGSIGVSSAQRAPVHVNMQSPHVRNMMGRGYGFSHYDQGYSNVSPLMSGMPPSATAAAPSAMVPFSPQSSDQGSASPQSPYGSPFGYRPPSPYGFGFGYGGGQYYDRRGGQTFSNFFPRTDGAGIQGGSRGTRGNMPYQMRPWWASTPYHHNWRMTQNAPGSYLTQSFEYSGRGWNAGSPQGRMPRPPGWGGSGIPPQRPPQGGTQLPTLQGGTNYSGNFSGAAMNGSVPSDPMEFQFRRPSQALDLSAGSGYSFGNAYNSSLLPNNYQRNFAFESSSVPNQGYQPQPNGAAGVPMVAPMAQGAIYPGIGGGTPPQINERAPFQPPQANGMVRPFQMIPQQVGSVNPIANPAQEQARQESLDQADQRTIQDQKQFLGAASAPESSNFDHEKLSELEQLRQDAYDNLLQSIQTGNQEARQKWFDAYQKYQREIQALGR